MSEQHTAENDATGPGWFWTQVEWAEWSNTLASLLPEEYEDDVAQEAIIERAVEDMATQLADIHALLTEYEDAGPLPAPYTNERALYERLCSALGRETPEESAAVVDQNLRSMGSEGLSRPIPTHGPGGHPWLTACGQDRANVARWTLDATSVTCVRCLDTRIIPPGSTEEGNDEGR